MNTILTDIVVVNVKGKNINYFINKIIKQKLQILKTTKINYNTIQLTLYSNQLENLNSIKGTYEITKVRTIGAKYLRNKVIKNHLFFLGMGLFIIILIILSNIITDIEIIHNDKKIRNIIEKELDKNYLNKYTIKKPFEELNKIKNNILNSNNKEIEWIEIDSIGTKYIIKVIERKQSEVKNTFEKQNVIAKKNAILKKIEAKNGEVISNLNTYVKKGEVIISGELKVYDVIKNTVAADGKIFGEVWYNVNVTYPLIKSNRILTGRKQEVITINILNKKINLFEKDNYLLKEVTEKKIIKTKLIPFYISKNKEKEVKDDFEFNTIDEAIKKAIEAAMNNIKNNHKENEKILSYKRKDIKINQNNIELNLFVTVYENITDYQKIEENPITN